MDDGTWASWYQALLVIEQPTPDECKEWIRHKSVGGRQFIEFGFPVGKWANLNDGESDDEFDDESYDDFDDESDYY